MTDLRQTLERATDDLPARDLAGGAWQRAGVVRARRRRRRLSAVGGALAVVAVIGVIAAPRFVGRPDPTISPAGPSPAATRTIAGSGPGTPLGEGDVQPIFDPRRFDSLPRAESPLPEDLRPDVANAAPIAEDPIDRAVAVVKEGGGGTFYALGLDGRWRSVDTGARADVPIGAHGSGPLSGPTLRADALSADGTKVVLDGLGYSQTYDFATQTSTRIDGEYVDAIWQPDDTLLLKPSYSRVSSPVDLGPTGLPVVGGFDDHGTFVTVEPPGAGHAFDSDLEVGSSSITGLGLGQVQSLAASSSLVVAGTTPLHDGPTGGRAGLMAVDPETAAAIAYLPIGSTEAGTTAAQNESSHYVMLGRLTVLAVTGEQALVAIRPYGVPAAETTDDLGAELVFSWDPASGVLHRVAQTSNRWRDLSVAADLLGQLG